MTSEQHPTVPADRYGRAGATPRRRPGRGRKVAIGVALTAAVAAVGWYSFARNAADPVTSEMVGFTAVDAEHVEARFQVNMPPGTTAVCTLDALAPSYAQVGTLDVPVGPSESRSTGYEVTIGTSQLATSVDIASCAVTGD
ncbi:DUF4307 domain-containing protein [Isoptericola aurantiacus]|uniref:DUF4307 domain-containing protein n=1 Tax=Isoptericola aurantiacus TaxID=3377839 RepID=UPI003839D312